MADQIFSVPQTQVRDLEDCIHCSGAISIAIALHFQPRLINLRQHTLGATRPHQHA